MEQLKITRLGALGDGVAQYNGRDVYIPFALEGELVRAKLHGGKAELVEVIEPSPLRQKAPCPHFTQCGGCAMQHVADEAYHAWKRDLVIAALAKEGIDAPVDPLIACAPHSRRRAVLTAENTEDGLALGYHKAQSHELIPIESCTVLTPKIVSQLPALQRLATTLAAGRKASFHLTVLDTETGLDIAVADLPSLSDGTRKAAIRYAVAQNFARLTYNDELLIEVKAPKIHFGDVEVIPPAGGFMQAVQSAEIAMAELVSQHLKSCKHVADLFSGAGTFALRLAKKSHVFAVESEAVPLQSLEYGMRFATGIKPLTWDRRDLFRRPLLPRELEDYTGLVFDPPRAGAEAQCKHLAKSKVAKVAAVSCNPQTLGRDLKILVDGGYVIDRIVPIDQFLWSAHVEIVALLSKKPRIR